VEKLFKDSLLYNEFKRIRGTPHYWEDVKRDLFAFLRQNKNPPTFFISLSMADTKWDELLSILQELSSDPAVKEKPVETLAYVERCRLIKNDPVTCVRYFAEKRQHFFNHFIKDTKCVFGEAVDHFGVVEFQHRGSPHTHFLLWMKDPPSMTSEEDVQSYVDMHISTDIDVLPEGLRPLQVHRHSTRCGYKENRKPCAFGFPRPPLDDSKVISPLPQSFDKKNKARLRELSRELYQALSDRELDENQGLTDFLKGLNIHSIPEYILVLRAGVDRQQMFYKRRLAHRYVNTFNPLLLKRWRANIDVQFCLNPYAVGMYIASYMCKGNKMMSSIFHKVKKDLEKNPATKYKSGLGKLGNVLFNYREVSAQEACFLLVSLPLRYGSRTVAFINTSFPENRIVRVKAGDVIATLGESESVYEEYAVVRDYQKRPPALEHVCLADFVAKYDRKRSTPIDTECQDYQVDEDTTENIVSGGSGGPIHPYRLRKVPKIIRFVNCKTQAGTYNRPYLWERVLLFVPFRLEQKHFDQDMKAAFDLHESDIRATEEEYRLVSHR
jgi:hypothetical protein